MLAMRGLDGQFVDSGGHLLTYHFGMLEQRLPLAGLDSPFPYVLAHSQVQTEEKLERWAVELGANILRGHVATDLEQREDDVEVTLRTPDGEQRTARAPYVVGCDGSRSVVREAAGIAFVGYEPSSWAFLADVRLTDPPPPGFSVHKARGSLTVVPLGPGHFRMYGFDPERQDEGSLTLDELREYVIELAGVDFGLNSASWLTRFSSATKVAERYRNDRVLLAGDAAHVHFPAGGSGLNVGIQDAMNLGWKLAAHLQGRADPGLLDTYDAERRPVGEELARHTLAQGALIQAMSPEGLELRGLMNRLLAEHPSVTAALVQELTGLDVAYPSLGSHPLVGARVPAPTATLSLLASGRPLLLLFANQSLPQSQSAAAALGFIVAQAPSSLSSRPGWDGLAAAIVRPDGHVWRIVEASPQADASLLSCLADLPARFLCLASGEVGRTFPAFTASKGSDTRNG
jgi:2-polyprenyl-6-methoxyphenol hydroxylase-like FAD-dependent oxidoreductase